MEWLVEVGELERNPALLVKSPKEPRRLPRGLTAAEVRRLLRVAPDARAVVIILLMVQEGLRRGEVAGLDLGDIDMAERTMLVRGKGGHERVLPISEETFTAIRRYLGEHPATAGPLVRRSLDQPKGVRWDARQGLSPSYVSQMMTQWMREAGIKAKPYDGRSAHALRHTAASDMLRHGAHVRNVQAALGHASLVTTQRYLPLIVGDLRESMGGSRYGGGE
jgi:integrase/recombinase XerC